MLIFLILLSDEKNANSLIDFQNQYANFSNLKK